MRIRYLTPLQLQEVLINAPTKREYYIFRILAETGVRVTEFLRIEKEDVNFQEHSILVKGVKGRMKIVNSKKQQIFKYRTVDISTNLSEFLRLHFWECNLTRKGIWDLTKKYANIHPHGFRHTYAINLLRLTKNIRYVQKQLGHENLRTTAVYLQFMDFTDEKKLLEKL